MGPKTVNASRAWALLRMWPPRCFQHNFHLLSHQKGAKFGCEGHERPVGEQCGPMIATVRVILEAPQVNQLVDSPYVADEIANQLLAEASTLQCRPALFTIKLGRLGHLANVQSVGAELIDSHDFLLFAVFSGRFRRLY